MVLSSLAIGRTIYKSINLTIYLPILLTYILYACMYVYRYINVSITRTHTHTQGTKAPAKQGIF